MISVQITLSYIECMGQHTYLNLSFRKYHYCVNSEQYQAPDSVHSLTHGSALGFLRKVFYLNSSGEESRLSLKKS